MSKDTEKKELVLIDKFNDSKCARVSQDLYALNRVRFRLNVHGYRLLYAIAQNLDTTRDIETEFPEYGYDLQAIFEYLGIKENGRRFEILDNALKNLGENILTVREVKKTGGIRWSGYAWLTKYQFSSDEKYLVLRINEEVKPFLMKLRQYTLVRPQDYLNLNSEYQNWFYPYLKNVVKLGKWRVSIEDLKFALFLENTPSYNPKESKNANENFFKYVIGIKVSEKAKIENLKATREKRKPKLYEWDYTTDRQGKPNGTLAGITEGTDIKVTASVEKTGRAYTHIIFYLSYHNNKRLDELKAVQEIEKDFGAVQERQKRSNKTSDIKTIVQENMPEIIPSVRLVYYTDFQIEKHAKEMKMSKTLFIEQMRLKRTDDGRYYKEF